MAWQDNMRSEAAQWLLEAEEPGVRYLALRDLFDCPVEDRDLQVARQTAYAEGPIGVVLAHMAPEGYWVKPGPGYNPKYRSTVWSILLLAQLGAAVQDDERVARACAYVLDHALLAGGQFTCTGPPSGTIDCLQGNLTWSLLALGCDDPRLETAVDWMARSVTGEGVMPVEEARAAKVVKRKSPEDYEVERRYYAYNSGPLFECGPNGNLPCAWGGVKVMMAFSRWPEERRTPQVERAIDAGAEFFLSTDPAKADYPTRTGSKPSRDWWKFGFPVFYITDILQIVEALVGLGYGHDPRLANALQVVREKQDAQGRWALEFDYPGKTWVDFGPKKQPNPWVTLRALRVLKALG